MHNLLIKTSLNNVVIQILKYKKIITKKSLLHSMFFRKFDYKMFQVFKEYIMTTNVQPTSNGEFPFVRDLSNVNTNYNKQ